MKSIIKYVLVLSFFLFFYTFKVYALENDTVISKEYLPDVYFNKIVDQENHWGRFPVFKLEEDIIYCIEPGTPIKSLNYSSYYNWDVTGLSNSIRQNLELIAYYGYDYPNHQDKFYLMATQKLIWEALGIEQVYYTTKSYGQGTIINIDAYVNEIKQLIAHHYLKPSFDNTTLTGVLDTGFTLIDSNNEVSKFSVSNSDGNEVIISGNQVFLKLTNPYSNQITLSKTINKQTVIFQNDTSQTLAKLGITDEQVYSFINVKTLLGIININTNNNDKFTGDSLLFDAIYEIRQGDQFKVQIKTDIDGNATMPSLNSGRYTINQISPSHGYLLDSNEYQAMIDEDSQECNVQISPNLIKKELTIIVTLNNESQNLCQLASGINFAIYSHETLVTTIITNDEGYASIWLPYGTYEIKPLTTIEGYKNIKASQITINETSTINNLEYSYVQENNIIQATNDSKPSELSGSPKTNPNHINNRETQTSTKPKANETTIVDKIKEKEKITNQPKIKSQKTATKSKLIIKNNPKIIKANFGFGILLFIIIIMVYSLKKYQKRKT